MKNEFYINQNQAVALGLNAQEVMLITCIHDLIPIGKNEKNNKHEVYITPSTFTEEYPMLPFKNRVSLYRRLKELEERGFITKSTIANKSYYGITELGDMLFIDEINVNQKGIYGDTKE